MSTTPRTCSLPWAVRSLGVAMKWVVKVTVPIGSILPRMCIRRKKKQSASAASER